VENFFISLKGYTGKYSQALRELTKMILIHPEDYEVSFLIEENLRLLKLSGADLDEEIIVNALDALQESNLMYYVTKLKVNQYEPVSADNNEDDDEDNVEGSKSILPTAKQVKAMFGLRRPFVISLGSFNQTIGWRTNQWSNIDYLVERAGEV